MGIHASTPQHMYGGQEQLFGNGSLLPTCRAWRWIAGSTHWAILPVLHCIENHIANYVWYYTCKGLSNSRSSPKVYYYCLLFIIIYTNPWAKSRISMETPIMWDTEETAIILLDDSTWLLGGQRCSWWPQQCHIVLSLNILSFGIPEYLGFSERCYFPFPVI